MESKNRRDEQMELCSEDESSDFGLISRNKRTASRHLSLLWPSASASGRGGLKKEQLRLRNETLQWISNCQRPIVWTQPCHN